MTGVYCQPHDKVMLDFARIVVVGLSLPEGW